MTNETPKETGGAAFPCAAFSPSDDEIWQYGMDLRDWFAGMALQGIVSAPDACLKVAPNAAYMLADAMLEVRKK